MPIHLLEQTQLIHAPLARCWAFFSDPHNLAQITPPDLGFEVLGPLPPAIHPGLMIRYRVRPLLGLPMRWLTEITHVENGRYFVDEQRLGPYRLWHHEHTFEALDPRRTRVHDRVHYALPGGWLGNLVHPFLVRPRLEQIFAFRTRAVERLFPPGAGPGTAAP